MPKNYVSNKDETVRMFESDFMEAFSRVHFTVPLYIYIPVILVMLYLSIFVYYISAINIIGLFIGGIAAWTLTEYLLHRFVFHYKAKSKFGKKIHFIFPLLFQHCFIPVSLAHVVSSLAYPNLLGTKRLGCCCCCCC